MPGEFLVTDAAGDGMWRWGREQGELKKPAALSAGRGPDLAGAPFAQCPATDRLGRDPAPVEAPRPGADVAAGPDRPVGRGSGRDGRDRPEQAAGTQGYDGAGGAGPLPAGRGSGTPTSAA